MDSQFKKLIKSFGYARDGLKRGLQERNTKIHLAFVVAVTSMGFVLQISFVEWIVILLCFALVISLEMVNTAIEEICDLLNEKLKLQFHHTTAPRDLAAAAVLVSATLSSLIGLIVFLPKILSLF